MKKKFREAFLVTIANFWIELLFSFLLLELLGIIERTLWPHPIFDLRGDLPGNLLLAFLVNLLISWPTFMLYITLGDRLFNLPYRWLTFVHLLLYSSVVYPLTKIEMFFAQINREFPIWIDQKERGYYLGTRLIWVVVAAFLYTKMVRLIRQCIH